MSSKPVGTPLFHPGHIVATSHTLEIIPPAEILNSLLRHLTGDWGDVCEEDRWANDWALRRNGRLLSVYHSSDQTKFWIITESDRSVTTVLMPEDY